MSVLVAGQNVVLPPGPAVVSAQGAVEIGALYGIAVLPEGGRGWLSLQDTSTAWVAPAADGTVRISTDRLPADTKRIHVGVYGRRGATTIRSFLPASFVLAGHAFRVEQDELGATFLAFAEIYLRNGTWKLRACSDWSVAGVGDFARRHGCVVTDEAARVVDGPNPVPGPGGRGYGSSCDWSGSAFLVGPGIAATNAHVIKDAGRIMAIGDAGRFDAEAVVADEGADIALVRVNGCGTPSLLTFRSGFDLSAGKQVYAVGFPMSGFLGAGPQITSGMVANCLGPGNDTRLLQISAPIQPGSSGGPVLDASGRLVGVAVASLTGAQNVNFAVRAALVSHLAQSLGIDVGVAGEVSPVAPDRILRACRGSLFKLECHCR